MTVEEAILEIKYRIDSATQAVGAGIDGNAYKDLEMAITALEEIQQYRAIGTVSEFRELKEKATAKNVLLKKCGGCQRSCNGCYGYVDRCPNCNGELEIEYGEPYKYCPFCGQKLVWSEGKEQEDGLV